LYDKWRCRDNWQGQLQSFLQNEMGFLYPHDKHIPIALHWGVYILVQYGQKVVDKTLLHRTN
jgi:hypothetical protein